MAGGSVARVNQVQLGQYPAPVRVVAHLSDPHLLADSLQYGEIDTLANLRAMLERVAACDPPPQALVFTGDLADLAEPAAYELLRATVEPVAETLGAEVVWCMGNHDERAAYARALEHGASTRAGQFAPRVTHEASRHTGMGEVPAPVRGNVR